jgi:hypothetical protein
MGIFVRGGGGILIDVGLTTSIFLDCDLFA